MSEVLVENDAFADELAAALALFFARRIDRLELDRPSSSATAARLAIFADDAPSAAPYAIEFRGTGFSFADGDFGGGAVTAIAGLGPAGDELLSLTGFQPFDPTGAVSALNDSAAASVVFVLSLFRGDSLIEGSSIAAVYPVTGSGDDTVRAGGGDDTVHHLGPGNLTYSGGPGSDTLSFQALPILADPYPVPRSARAVIDLTGGTGTSPYGGTLTLADVENVVGTSEADTIIGNAADNTFGDGLFDRGADRIEGGAGDDRVILAPRVEAPGVIADGGPGIDTLVFQASDTGASVNRLDLTDQSRNAGVFAGERYTNFERFEQGATVFPFQSTLSFVGTDAAEELTVRTAGQADLGGGDDRLNLFGGLPIGFVADGGPGQDTLGLFSATLDFVDPSNNAGPIVGADLRNFEIYAVETSLAFRSAGGSQTFLGSDLNNIVTFLGGTGGNHVIDMLGAQNDIGDRIIYPFARAEITERVLPSGDVEVRLPGEETHTLRGVERIFMTDGRYLYGFEGTDIETVYRVYAASLARAPDDAGFRFWSRARDEGLSRKGLAEAFIASDEFIENFLSDPSDGSFIAALYENVLERSPDAAGSDFWLTAFQSGRLDRADMLIAFSESAENVARTADDLDDGIFLL